ncbi:MAG TPA: hypothetical protein VM779_15520 [Thermoanaerobaculia bacterium]|nr:hypothetical protein [Thermoanaerobaculia bacterium]
MNGQVALRAARALMLLFAFFGAIAARAEDIVIMRDGSERSGRLELCDEQHCRLSGTPIPVAQVRSIHLDGTPKQTLPRKSEIVVLRDGTIREGRVIFVNLGTVDTEHEEIDRSLVAAIIFSALPGEPVQDYLILRDGSVRSGTLSSCNAASCTLDGAVTPLASVEWVGLAREDSAAPRSTADEVHKIDGTVVPGRLSRIDATNVSTTRGPIPRAETAWIHLTPPPETQPAQPGAFGAPQPAPEPQQPQPPPPPPPPPPPSPQPQPPLPQPTGGETTSRWPPQPGAPGVPRRGALWTGTVQARLHGTVDGIYSQLDIEADVRLRESITPLLVPAGGTVRTVGTFISLLPEGNAVKHTFTCRGEGLTCRGSGTITYGDEGQGKCSGIWLKSADVDVSNPYGFDIPRSGMYSLCLDFPGNPEYDVTYSTSEGSSTEELNFISPVIGDHPSVPATPMRDLQVRTFEGGAARMEGSFTIPATGAFVTMDASWSVCREGVVCSAPPPLPPPGGGGPDEPPDPDDDDDDEEDCAKLSRLIDGMRALREAYEMHEASFIEAERNRDAARDSIYGFSGTLSQFFVSLGGFAAEGLKGSLGDLVGLIGSGLGLAQEYSGDNVAQAVVGMSATDLAFSPAEAAGVSNAVRKADEVLKATGSDSQALRTYADEIGRSDALRAKGQNVVKGLSVVVSARDYIDKTNGLADSIQDYLDHRSEANSHKENMENTQDLMAEKQTEIDEARAALDGPCPGIPSTRTTPRRNQMIETTPVYRLVQATAPAAEPAATPEELRTAVAALQDVEAKMSNAITWLLPFFAGVTDDASPELQRALLRRAEPDLRAVKDDVEAAVEAGRRLESLLGNGGVSAAAAE